MPSQKPTLTPENGIKRRQPGEMFVTFCIVRSKEVRYKQNGQPYLLLELGDKSGRLKARLWDHIDDYSKATPIGGIVKIQAMVQAVGDRKELKVLKLRAATPNDLVKEDDLLPEGDHDREQLKQALDDHRQSIRNTHLRNLLAAIFRNEQFAESYYRSPAGKLWHHNYLGGMLEHVVNLLDYSDMMKIHYPAIDIDLLKTGIICHDLGKVDEYMLNGFIDFSDEGRLLGNTAISYGIVERHIRELENFPEPLRIQLQHLVLSHPTAEQGGAVKPMTLEAVVLQQLIQLDAHANALMRIRENDVLPENRWSKYIPLLERFVYVAEPSENYDERK
jgi:3'-5' exoribonuclease